MKSLTVVVEARADAALLRRLFESLEAGDLRFFAGAGRMALSTVARNLLVHEPGSVLLVMDADSHDAGRVAETRAMTEAVLRRVAGEQQFAVFPFVPELEVVFFEAPDVLRKRFPSLRESETPIAVGQVAPRQQFCGLLAGTGMSREQFYRSLDDGDIAALRTGAQAGRLLALVHEMMLVEEGMSAR